MKGIVIKSTGAFVEVKSYIDGQIYSCSIRGRFRNANISSTNPIAVGDSVDFEITDKDSDDINGRINEVHKRHNYLVRKAKKLSSEFQIIASNLDLVIPVFTLFSPITSLGFLDRILVTAEAYHIPVLILFTKSDIYDKAMLAELNSIKDIYEKIGYETLTVSTQSGEGIEDFKKVISNKTSLLCGLSGAGKSTLINALAPDLNVKTGDVSLKYNKGRHTTTFAEMFQISENTNLIDTPGIRDFELIHMEPDEIHTYFPEFLKLNSKCKFSNCIHINEPSCAVIEGLETGEISTERYDSYQSMYSGKDLYN